MRTSYQNRERNVEKIFLMFDILVGLLCYSVIELLLLLFLSTMPNNAVNQGVIKCASLQLIFVF